MAKQRLVDFRGGINQKISPHMIGDSQGQSAQDVDLSAVRLRGRKKILARTDGDQSTYANGNFFYETGNLNVAGQWKSTNPDDSTYITDATDFAVWNKDLYVARHDDDGDNSSDGTLQVFFDGANTPSQLQHNPPAAVVVTPDYPFKADEANWISNGNSSSDTGKQKQLIAAYAGQAYIPSTPVTTLQVTQNQLFSQGGGVGTILSNGVMCLNWEPTLTTSSSHPSTYTSNSVPTNQNLDIYLYGASPARSNPGTNYEISFNTHFGAWTTLNTNNTVYASSTSSYTNYTAGTAVSSYQGFGLSYNPPFEIRFLDWNTAVYKTTNNSKWWALFYIQSGNFDWDNFSSLSNSGAYYAAGGYHYYDATLDLSVSVYQITSQNVTTTSSGQAYIPSTNAFTYGDARGFIYRQFTSDADKLQNWANDYAQGATAPWLANRSLTSSTEDGYYLTVIRESGTTPSLPTESQERTLATLASNSNYITDTDTTRTPQRLDFAITAPTDDTSSTNVRAYKLYRKDSTTTTSVDLGYIKPDTGISFTYSGGTTVTISGLDATKTYRLNWYAYQNTTVSFTSSSNVTVTQKTNGGIGIDGIEFIGNLNSNTEKEITLNKDSDDDIHAVDFWLEERVIHDTGYDSSATWAVCRCADLFDYNNTYFCEESDFLDCFASGVSSGLGSGAAQTAPPDHLKFLRESNNFFFGVGTDQTNSSRYGSAGNKAGSFLFVSEYNNPRNWPLASYVEFEDEITGIATYPGELIVWTKQGTYRVTGSRSDQMRKTKLATIEGMLSGAHRTAQLVGRYLVWVSQTGICFYNGSTVTNLTRGRFETFPLLATAGSGGNASLHAGHLNDKYYVCDGNETGFVADFGMEGFPISEVDLVEDHTSALTNSSGNTLSPVLVYRPSENKLYSRRGVIEAGTTRNKFNFKTREFDGGAFGSLKLVKSVTINGSGNGKVQVYLDGKPAYQDYLYEYDFAGQTYLKKTVDGTGTAYRFYYGGVLVNTFQGSYIPNTGANESGSMSEGNTWSIDAGAKPDANGPAWNVTFGNTVQQTVVTNSTFNYYEQYYSVRNNLVLSSSPKLVSIDSTFGTDEPARIYLPASRTNNPYGLSVADVWSVEITEWENGDIDWIDTDYEILSS
jgi:hypothetical protein